MKIYKPRKIIEARIQVEEQHTKVAKGKAHKEDEALKELINRIVSLSKDSVARFSEILTSNQLHQISEYLCLNFWNVKLDNLFIVMDAKATSDEWNTIFSNWQNRYDREPDGERIRRFLAQSLTNNKVFQDYIKEITEQARTLNWISSDNYIYQLCRECLDVFNSYESELLWHGVLKDTALFNRCMIVYFQICERKNYINYGPGALRDHYVTWRKSDKEKFCYNLFEQLSINDIEMMRPLFQTIDTEFWEDDMKKILSSKGYALYQVWINIKSIENAFNAYEDKNRREFWMKYILGNTFHNYTNTLVIDFGAYVAVEFKGKAAGPAYLYTKNFYTKTVQNKMLYMYKQEFQSWEREQYIHRTPGFCRRMPHQPYDSWMWDFMYDLEKFGIKQSKL